jgi:hypothetical protein
MGRSDGRNAVLAHPVLESVHGGRYSDEHMFGAGGLTGLNQQGADGWT